MNNAIIQMDMVTLQEITKHVEDIVQECKPDSHSWCMQDQIKDFRVLQIIINIKYEIDNKINEALANETLEKIVDNYNKNVPDWDLVTSKYLATQMHFDVTVTPQEKFSYRILFYHISHAFLHMNASWYCRLEHGKNSDDRSNNGTTYQWTVRSALTYTLNLFQKTPELFFSLLQSPNIAYNIVRKVIKSFTLDAACHAHSDLRSMNLQEQTVKLFKILLKTEDSLNWYEFLSHIQKSWGQNTDFLARVAEKPGILEIFIYQNLSRKLFPTWRVVNSIETTESQTDVMLKQVQNWLNKYPKAIQVLTDSPLSLREKAILLNEPLLPLVEQIKENPNDKRDVLVTFLSTLLQEMSNNNAAVTSPSMRP